jgi:leader peptidase (prepilin peptidase)/N-methyltransferase
VTVLAVFLLGAIVGSFLNVCIIRLPLKESIVFPGSHCLSCRRQIAWYDNVPILSWLVLKGRCRNCGAKISPQYLVVELAAAGIFVLFYKLFGLSAEGVVYLTLTLVLLVISLIDWKYQIIPDLFTLPGIAAGPVVSLIFPAIHGTDLRWAALLESLGGVLLGGGVLYVIGTAAERILKKEAMGGGDVKLLAMIGAFTGWKGVVWTLFVSSFAGSIAGLALKFTGGDERVPYGPFLAIGVFFYFLFGLQFFNWYGSVIGWNL